MEGSQEDVKRSVRFPADLYRRLERIAKREHRSVTSQLVAMLEDSVKRYEREENERGNSELLGVDVEPVYA